MLCLGTRLVCVVLAGSLLGCAPSVGVKRLSDLRTRVSDLQRQLQREKRRVEDLNNRVFLLQDQLDSRRVATSRDRAKARAKARPASRRAPAPRPVARRVTAPRDSAADIARRKARRRLPVVRLRRHRRHVRRTRYRRRGRRVARRAKRGKRGKRIVLRLTGTPSAPRSPGQRKKPMGPVPKVSHRLAVVPLPGGRAPRPSAIGSPLAEYRAARALFARKKYSEAAKAFSRFSRSHPKHAHADNAQYWLAECFYRRGKVAKAAWVLRKLLKKYPSGNKAPSALLKLALCVQRLGRRAKARKILAQVVQLYPGTREAKVAASHLRRRR